MTSIDTSFKPTVLILGATGRIGTAAAEAFDAAGWSVVAQSRRTPSAAWPRRARPLVADLSDIDGIAQQATGASVVLHAVNPPYAAWDREALPALAHGLDIAEQLQARLLLPGNVYNFGESMPPRLTPDTPFRPSTRKGELRCEMEAQMQRRAEQGRVRSTVLRAGDFFGTGRGNWFDRVITKDLARGRVTYLGPLDREHAWAYLPDLARAFVAIGKHELARRDTAAAASEPALSARRRSSRQAFEVFTFAGTTVTGGQLLDAIESAARELRVTGAEQLQRRSFPWALIRASGLVVPMFRELARLQYLWTVPHALDGAALAAAIGPVPSTPLSTAVRDSLIELGLAPQPASRSPQGA